MTPMPTLSTFCSPPRDRMGRARHVSPRPWPSSRPPSALAGALAGLLLCALATAVPPVRAAEHTAETEHAAHAPAHTYHAPAPAPATPASSAPDHHPAPEAPAHEALAIEASPTPSADSHADAHADTHATPPADAHAAESHAPLTDTAAHAAADSGAATDTHAAASADPHADTHAQAAAAHAAPAVSTVATPEEIVSLLRIGTAKTEQQDWPSAQLAFGQVLAARRAATAEQTCAALLGLARAHRGERQLTKAVAIYERYVKDFPADPNLPTIYLELGRCLRALGAHRLAINRFYSVINSTLKLPEEGQDTYRQLARTAQFEIAETYFLSGDYQQAERFFSRLRLLDLAPADRARASFKAAYAVQLRGEHEPAVTQLRAYLSLFPDGEDAPEARYLLSTSLRRLGRSQESLAAVLELLQAENTRTSADPAAWTRWQRKTGNQLANEFYEQGDISSALTIYRCLEELGGPPDWLVPVRYQIGLCQERLKQTALARATYQSILDPSSTKTGDASASSALVRDIAAMAAWRLQHLDWIDLTEKRLAPFPQPEPATTTSAASASSSDEALAPAALPAESAPPSPAPS